MEMRSAQGLKIGAAKRSHQLKPFAAPDRPLQVVEAAALWFELKILTLTQATPPTMRRMAFLPWLSVPATEVSACCAPW